MSMLSYGLIMFFSKVVTKNINALNFLNMHNYS